MALRETLTQIYPTPADLRRVLSDANIDAARIPLGSSAINDWEMALEEAERQGKWVSLIMVALREYPEQTGLWNAIRARAESQKQVQETSVDEMAPDTQRNPISGDYVTYREYAKEIQRIDRDIDDMRTGLLKEIEETRHKLREEYSPTVAKFSAMEKVITRQLVGQGIVIGMTIVAIVALIFVATGGRIIVGGG